MGVARFRHKGLGKRQPLIRLQAASIKSHAEISTSNKTSVQQFPFLDLKAQYRTIKAEIDAAIQRVLESQHL